MVGASLAARRAEPTSCQHPFPSRGFDPFAKPQGNDRNSCDADGRSRREADIVSLGSAGAFSVSPRNADKSRRCSSCPGWQRKNQTAAPFCLTRLSRYAPPHMCSLSPRFHHR